MRFFLLALVMCWFGHYLAAQYRSPLLVQPQALIFDNAAAIDVLHPQHKYTLLLAHRTAMGLPEDNPQYQLAGLQWRFLIDNPGFDNLSFAVTSHFSKSSFSPTAYCAGQVGLAVTFQPPQSPWLLSLGVQYGRGSWRVDSPPALRPWDLGDPLLTQPFEPFSKSFLNAAFFAAYRQPIFAEKNAGFYFGFVLPNFNLSSSNPYYSFSTSTTNFYIDRSSPWRQAAQSIQIGAYRNADGGLRLRLHASWLRNAPIRSHWTVAANGAIATESITNRKDGLIGLGLAVDQAKLVQTQLTFSFIVADRLTAQLAFSYRFQLERLNVGQAADLFFLANYSDANLAP